jgi:hypothetical protein
MTFENDVKMIYKGVVDRNMYDCEGKTPSKIIEDFKVHIMVDVNSILVYSVYTSSRFNFITPISDDLVTDLNELATIEISTNVVIDNNSMWLDFNSLL